MSHSSRKRIRTTLFDPVDSRIALIDLDETRLPTELKGLLDSVDDSLANCASEIQMAIQKHAPKYDVGRVLAFVDTLLQCRGVVRSAVLIPYVNAAKAAEDEGRKKTGVGMCATSSDESSDESNETAPAKPPEPALDVEATAK